MLFTEKKTEEKKTFNNLFSLAEAMTFTPDKDIFWKLPQSPGLQFIYHRLEMFSVETRDKNKKETNFAFVYSNSKLGNNLK